VADPLPFSLGPYLVQVPVEYGPRVIGFRRDPGPELLAQLGSDLVIERPDTGVYTFRGGHRLWASPEIPAVTYAPDDEPCQVTGHGDTVTVEGPPDRAGLTKRITIAAGEDGMIVDHVLTNTGQEPIEVAPWAITQLRLGGTAVIPIDGAADPERLQANASLVLWPYTNLTDPRVTPHPAAITVNAEAGPAFKVGTGPDPGRIGYLLDGHLFTKTVPAAEDGAYADRGAVAQFYLGDTFCELETVGPLVALDPEGSTAHREVWEIEECDGLDEALVLMTEGPR
jgi:hypothetical protein